MDRDGVQLLAWQCRAHQKESRVGRGQSFDCSVQSRRRRVAEGLAALKTLLGESEKKKTALILKRYRLKEKNPCSLKLG